MLVATTRVAITQLARNKLRTALTSLGVLIGVAAVISMVHIGQSATARVEADLAILGDNLLFVFPGEPGHGPASSSRPLALSDARALRREVPDIAAIGASAQRGVVATYGDATWRTAAVGIDQGYLEALSLELASGRPFAEGEALSGAPVCLIGDTVVGELFGALDPMDRAVRLGQLSCTVIGRTEARGPNTFGQDQDDYLLLPLSTFQRRIAGNRDVQTLFVKARDGVPTPRVQADVQAVMRQRRHVRPGMEDDFIVRDMAEIEDMLGSVTGVLTGLLAAIAAVSLVVGGIGIMNIMTVSVTERTREIGIRLAVGARARDVLLQFLVESVVLSVVGGVAGIGAGLLLSLAVARGMDLPATFDPATVALAFGVSAAIGVLFGFWPARRAASLRPIDALRHE